MEYVLSTYKVLQLGFERKYAAKDVDDMDGPAGLFLKPLYKFVQCIKRSKRVSNTPDYSRELPYCKEDTLETSDEPHNENGSIQFKHYRVAVKTSQNKYRIYESNGDFDNLKKWEEISTYQHNDYDKEHLLSYDFESGVYVCVYPNMNKKVNDVQHRADLCHQLLDDPYYSFASLNCENVSNYIMSGRGHSKQLTEMDTSMWVFSDIMDLYISFYKDIIFIILALCVFGTDGSLVAEFLFVLGIMQRENLHISVKMKEEKFAARQIFKYMGSFCMRLTLVSMSNGIIGAQTLASLSFLFMSPCLGNLHDRFNLSHVTTKAYSYIRALLKWTFIWCAHEDINVVFCVICYYFTKNIMYFLQERLCIYLFIKS